MKQLQALLGISASDIGLLFGASGLLIGLLILGIAGSGHSRRWLRRVGWLGLLAGAALLVFGIIQGRPRSNGPGIEA